jgi:hypothetical protein
MLVASMPVEAHCYSRWHYPWQQRCGVARQMARSHERGHNLTKFREVLSPLAISNQEHPTNKVAILPLPSLARADLDGGEADEPTRAKVLLRAALEASR